jgi:hypothetical protein
MQWSGTRMADEEPDGWRVFWRDRPGQRFARRYERRRELRGSVLRRVLRMAAGGVMIVVGVIFLPLPGPGFVPILFGAAMLAGESFRLSQLLDRTEARVRRWLKR